MLMDLRGLRRVGAPHGGALCALKPCAGERDRHARARCAAAAARTGRDRGSLDRGRRALPADIVEAPVPVDSDASLALHAEVMSARAGRREAATGRRRAGRGVCRDLVGPNGRAWHAPLKRYLAGKAFASWTAYQGRGVLTIVRGLDAALALVRVEAARECRNAGRALDADLLREAFRDADFVLNHLAVGEELADAWSRADLASPIASR